jgi:NADH-quinone oxidoreductase subunit L
MLLPNIPEAAAWVIYFAPLASFVAIAAYVRRTPLWAGRLTIAAVGLSFLLSLWALDTAIGMHGDPAAFQPHLWVELFALKFTVGIRLDGLSAVMLIVVSGVSLLVQVYSTGYMHGDGGYARYFAYMSLFTMAMLGLVLSSSLLQLFVHWELVGLTSYLLIGFWFDRPAAAAAAKKAFIVTRFGDFAFLVVVVMIWTKTGTFDIAQINHMAPTLSGAVLAGFTLGLLSGAAGKSAQFPLHFWLPDAMEGPTPVSSLIHSATMVAAGVYLLARFFPTLHAAPSSVTMTIAYVGGFTAIFAATMGVVATDIKRMLAYSTISQLGYMVMALGLGGYVAAIFHLFTHAFFKSLLFQGSGSVNHATNTFDMRLMGGLRRSMPITFWTFLAGSLALAGLVPFSGYWSKDEILLQALHQNRLLFWVGVGTAGLTALYVFRAIFLTFFGEYRGGAPSEHGHADEHHAAPHESPMSMWGPLVILSIPAIAFGFWGFAGFGGFIEGALEPSLRSFEGIKTDTLVLASSTFFVLAGIGVAAAVYFYGSPSSESIRRRFGPLFTLVDRKYFVNEIVEDGIVRRGLDRGLGRALAWFDSVVVDGVVNGVGKATRRAGDVLRRFETGQVQAYTSLYVLGVVVAVVAIFVFGANVLER